MTDNKETVDVKEQENISLADIFQKEAVFAPFVNIYETSNDFVLVANMPGVSKDDVKLKLDEAVNRKYILNEAGGGNYFRKFKISNSIDESKIDAKFENGQLVVTLPKHDRIKPRSINIK